MRLFNIGNTQDSSVTFTPPSQGRSTCTIATLDEEAEAGQTDPSLALMG